MRESIGDFFNATHFDLKITDVKVKYVLRPNPIGSNLRQESMLRVVCTFPRTLLSFL